MQKEIEIDQKCPFCKRPGVVEFKGPKVGFSVRCGGCGEFEFDERLIYGWPGEDESRLHLLAGFARENTEARRDLTVSARPDVVRFSIETMPSIRLQLPVTIKDRASKLLLALCRKSKEFGASIEINVDLDYALGYAKSKQELWAMARFLESSRFCTTVNSTGTGFSTAILVSGFEEAARLLGVNRDSAQGFVAMSFDDGLRSLFDGPIFNAIAAAGYKPMRIDRKDHNNQIVDEMLAEIRRSRFVVADFTSHRNGVYLEAGFAMGLGIPVIWLVRKDHMDDAHFDTKQYNFIDWEPGDEVGERLYNRIRATIGEWPVIQSPAEQAVLIEAMRALTPDGAPTRKD